jgi:DNA-binding NarL/FixJ family response regulator
MEASPFSGSSVPAAPHDVDPPSDEASDRSRSIRVAVAHQHTLVRAGLRLLVESGERCEVVVEIDGGTTTSQELGLWRPDVIVVDADGDSGIRLDLVAKLVTNGDTRYRVIVLTATGDADGHRRTIEQGAVGVVPKDAPVASFLRAIERVHAGEIWLSRSKVTELLQYPRSGNRSRKATTAVVGAAALSPRERQVAELVCDGLKNEEIAKKLFISKSTVRHHLTSIFAKLAITGRYHLISLAFDRPVE